MIDKVKIIDSIDDVCYIWNTSNPSAMTRNFDFCKNNRHSLFEYASLDIMNKNNMDDKWISGIMKMLTHMYEIRNELKNPIVKRAWSDKFKKECDMVFNNGQFCH